MITAIAPWFGSKRSLAPEIVRELGPHSSYWELCCGSMAVLFKKTRSAHEHVNDLHRDLINLARVVRDPLMAVTLESRCVSTLYHEELFQESQEEIRVGESPADAPDVDRAYHFMVASWMGRNGIGGLTRLNKTFAVRWTPGGGSGAVRWQSAADAIPVWHQRLRLVTMFRRDLFKVAEEIEDVDKVAIYIDPPYFMDSRGHSDRYKHEFVPEQHAQLAELLDRFQNARVVVSYYEHPMLVELYPEDRWTKRDVYRNKNLHVQNRRGANPTIAPEVLLVNGPSYAAAEQPTLF